MRAFFVLVLGMLAPSVAFAAAASSQTPSFRDVSIDLRCTALSGFVNAFADQHLYVHGYKEVGCSEGNGIGGATYELEFKLKAALEVRAYILRIFMGGQAVPETQLCLQTASENICSKKFTAPPAPSEAHFIQSGKPADSVINYYTQIPQLSGLLPAAVVWASSEQKFNRIFGTDFQAFVTTMLDKSIMVPISTRGETSFLKMRLTASNASRSSGKVQILSDLPVDVQACLGCSDKLCETHDLSYHFNNRFFAVTGKPRNRSGDEDASKVGLAWVMDGPEPVAKGEPGWRFLCGISRYSVQIIRQ